MLKVEADLHTELLMLKNMMHRIEFSLTNLKETSGYQVLFRQVSKLFRLLLTMPATSATSERLFSLLCNMKTYLHTTMNQERLNHSMMMHIHKDRKIDAFKNFYIFKRKHSQHRPLYLMRHNPEYFILNFKGSVGLFCCSAILLTYI